MRIDPIELGAGTLLPTDNRFLVAEAADEAAIGQAVEALVAEGAQVLVASAAFGVDNTASEERVREARAAMPDCLPPAGMRSRAFTGFRRGRGRR